MFKDLSRQQLRELGVWSVAANGVAPLTVRQACTWFCV